MIVEALPFQTHLAVSRIDSRRTASTWTDNAYPHDSHETEISLADVWKPRGNNAIRDNVVRRIRAEVEAGTYLTGEKMTVVADQLRRTLRDGG